MGILPLEWEEMERRGTGCGSCGITPAAGTELAGIRLALIGPAFETGPLCAVPEPSDIALNENNRRNFAISELFIIILVNKYGVFTHIHVCQNARQTRRESAGFSDSPVS